jgi:hypothetical protein
MRRKGGRNEGRTKSLHAVTRNSLQKLQQPLTKCGLRERLARVNLFARKAAVRVQRQSDISDVSVTLAEGDSVEGEGERTTEGMRVWRPGWAAAWAAETTGRSPVPAGREWGC